MPTKLQSSEVNRLLEKVFSWPADLEHLADELLSSQSPSAYRWVRYTLLFVVAVTLAALVYLDSAHQRVHAQDTAMLLDGAWRVFQGQIPHDDFYSPLGAVPLWILGLGLQLSGPEGSSLPDGYTFVFPFVVAWAWWIAKGRFSAFHAFWFSVFVGLLVVAPHRIDHPYMQTTYAMQHNRFGWALFCLLAPPLLLRPRRPWSQIRQSLEPISTGAVLTLLLFTKINYFLAALVLVVIAWLLVDGRRRAILLTLASFFVSMVCLAALSGFSLRAFLQDMQMMAAVQRVGGRTQEILLRVWADIDWIILLFFAIWVLSATCRPMRRGVGRWRVRLVVAALAFGFLGPVICSANFQNSSSPTFGVAALLLCEGFRRTYDLPTRKASDSAERTRYVTASFLATFLIGLILMSDLASIGYSVAWKALRAPQMPQSVYIDSPVMADMIFDPLGPATQEEMVLKQILNRDPRRRGGPTAYQYVHWINDGLSLLRPYVNEKSRITTMDMYNPFPFLVELPSPKGDALFWSHNRVFDKHSHPRAETVFQEVTLVMVPKRPLSFLSSDTKMEIFGTYLQREFEKTAESTLWVLYRRGLTIEGRTGGV